MLITSTLIRFCISIHNDPLLMLHPTYEGLRRAIFPDVIITAPIHSNLTHLYYTVNIHSACPSDMQLISTDAH